MQSATSTVNRYLTALLAATLAWITLMALLAHFALPWHADPMHSNLQHHLTDSGFTVSWRWWVLLLLSAVMLWMFILLGRVGTRGSADDRVYLGLVSLTLIWSAALAISGGAANAANAIQLILIAAAFLTLSSLRAWSIFAMVVGVQSIFLLAMFIAERGHSGHAGHASEFLHYVGMSVTFLLAAVLLALTITHLRRSLQAQQQEVQAMREAQLRQEQILAMGTASAQITHELATPLATIGMLYDELAESLPDRQAVRELERPIDQVKGLLQNLREVTQQIQSQSTQSIDIQAVITQLQQQISLHFSAAQVRWLQSEQMHPAYIQVDLTLVPALLGLIRNAIEASADTLESAECTLDSRVTATHWHLHVSNPTTSTARQRLAQFNQLGREAVKSERGLGFGLLLSHATLERFAGALHVDLDPQGVFHQVISLPVVQAPRSTKQEP